MIREVGDLLGIHPEALRRWVKKARAQAAADAVAAKLERERIRELGKEVAELRRANESSRSPRRIQPRPVARSVTSPGRSSRSSCGPPPPGTAPPPRV
ncbi:transposase [Streptomyces sp.]|uniref:transposase n=1 Tax=Streptomyces sp. TaxID=1931 RepID=UPI0039C9A615